MLKKLILKKGATLVFPLASMIETGNHIAKTRTRQRRELAVSLAEKMKMAADETTPWAAFADLLPVDFLLHYTGRQHLVGSPMPDRLRHKENPPAIMAEG
ncbi:hypothetical protein XM38_026290 [Halomicronema hongdechloris C2206]|uniref:Uncharacterized protein n=2 Tax=Halomicronema hongdechloris TaxID=1209493 RepID=A0A1Z3HN26_9CYAN|nr:hypothetical protein XM38_026290 [Halomicronema hongdechloris C2206]